MMMMMEMRRGYRKLKEEEEDDKELLLKEEKKKMKKKNLGPGLIGRIQTAVSGIFNTPPLAAAAATVTAADVALSVGVAVLAANGGGSSSGGAATIPNICNENFIDFNVPGIFNENFDFAVPDGAIDVPTDTLIEVPTDVPTGDGTFIKVPSDDDFIEGPTDNDLVIDVPADDIGVAARIRAAEIVRLAGIWAAANRTSDFHGEVMTVEAEVHAPPDEDADAAKRVVCTANTFCTEYWQYHHALVQI